MTFHPFITVPSRLLHLYSTEDKTPRLMVKQFSTARNTQRNSQSYIDKREEGDRGDRMRKGRVKRGERSLASPLPRSKLLTFLGALQGHRPRWAVCFVPLPGPSTSGSWVGLFLLEIFFFLLLVIGLFRFSIPSWLHLGKLYISQHLLISSRSFQFFGT